MECIKILSFLIFTNLKVNCLISTPKGTGPQLLKVPTIEKLEKKTLRKKNWDKQNLGKKFLNKIFQFQVTIPSAHLRQISSRSDYCITLS